MLTSMRKITNRLSGNSKMPSPTNGKRGAHGPNETIAKSMYWQAESYVKTEAFEDASAVLESLIELFAQAGRGHYLVVAAQRRLETLKARGASHARNF